MSMDNFLILQSVLQWAAVTAGVISLGYLVAAIIGWSSPYRKHRLLRFGLFLVSIPFCIVAHVVVLHGLVFPSIAKDANAELESFVDSISIVRLNDESPIFSARQLDGSQFNLGEYREKLVLVNFFSTDCENCWKELPMLETFWEQHRDNQDFAMVAVGIGKDQQALDHYSWDNGLSFPIVDGMDKHAFSFFAKKGVPRTYLISPDGKICFESVGFWEHEMEELRKKLVDLLSP